jgi:hypothetical protein
MKHHASKHKSDEQATGPQAWQSVRKSRIARAKQLLKEKDYPPEEILESVARLLARHLKPGPGR